MKKIKKTAKLSNKINTRYFEPHINNPFAESTSSFTFQKGTIDNHENANASEIPFDERAQFISSKREEGETSKRQNNQQETLKQGIIHALSDQLFTISKLKKQQQDLKEQCRAYKKITLKLTTNLEKVTAKNKQLEKEIFKYKKDSKKLQKEIDSIKQIVLLQSTYANICSKNTPFEELASEWKYACKHPQKIK